MAEVVLVASVVFGLLVWGLCTALVSGDAGLSRSLKVAIPLVLLPIYVIIVPLVIYGRLV